MLTKSKGVFSAVLILAVASAAFAMEDSVPNIDLQNLCRSNQRAIDAAFGAGNISMADSCIAGEQGARAQLVKDWATFSASDKTLCMRPTVYLPSYVEWLTCAEMQRDLKKIRKEQPVSIPPSPNARRQSGNSRTGSETKPCPVVQFGSDGSITGMIAC
jgi:hypothetical protein